MKHLEWDDNDNLQNIEDPSALEDAANKIENLQNAYNNMSELLSNIGANKEGEDEPPSSDDASDTDNNNEDLNDESNDNEDINTNENDSDNEDDDNDLDNDGVNDNEESPSDDDKNGNSDIDKENDRDADGKDDSDEANEEGNSDEEDEEEDDDETDEGDSGGGGIIGKVKGKIKAKIAHTALKIKIYMTVFIIVFLMFLITEFSSILTPDSLKAVLAYQFEEVSEEVAGAWISFTQSVEEMVDEIVAFFTNLFTGDAGDEESGDEIDSTEAYAIGEYDPYHQYNDSLKSNYTEIETALKQAYKDAKDEAKQFCNDNGYSWRKSKKTLSATNSDSWKSVYAGSNFGDLLSVANILLDEEAYESEEGYDPETFDAARFSEFMKDENTIKHLYHITYVAYVDSNESDPDEAKYVTITIWPYDVYDLFLMGTPKVVNSDGSIEDTVDGANYTNKEWSDNINNYDFMQTRTDQIEAICNEENYELYQLDKKTELNSQRASSSLLTTISNNVSLDDVSGTNKKVVYEALKRKGLDDVHIAAVMGNL